MRECLHRTISPGHAFLTEKGARGNYQYWTGHYDHVSVCPEKKVIKYKIIKKKIFKIHISKIMNVQCNSLDILCHIYQANTSGLNFLLPFVSVTLNTSEER